MLDGSIADADLHQLGTGHDPMLPLSELSDRLVKRRAWFSPYSGVNVPLAAHPTRIRVTGALRAPERHAPRERL
jgi:hypothetical protein